MPYDPAQDKMEQYELMRKRVGQQAQAEAQGQQDALKRRFAALGGLNSGAYIKQQQIASDKAMERRQQALEGVDMAEAQERQRRREVVEGRDFASGEAEKQRGFMARENQLGRDFTADQAKLHRDFTERQQYHQNEFQKKLFERDMAFKESVAAMDHATKLKALDQGAEQLKLDREIADFNKEIARWEQQQATSGLLEGITGKGGLFGVSGTLRNQKSLPTWLQRAGDLPVIKWF